jgi:hypothetical protein
MPATEAQKLLYGSRLTEDSISNRIVRGYNATRVEQPDAITAGAQIVPAQTETAQFMADKAGLPNIDATSAVLASFSTSPMSIPRAGTSSQRTDPNMGRAMALQLLNVMDDTRARWHINEANKKQAKINSLLGPRGAGKLTHATEISALQEHIEQHRQRAGLTGTPLGLIPMHHISAAVQLMLGRGSNPLENVGKSRVQGNPDNPIRFTGTLRTGDLAQQIHSGGTHPVYPADADVYDLVVGKNDIPYEEQRGITDVGRYRSVQGYMYTPYERLKSRSALPENFDKLSDFMGTVWLSQRQAKLTSPFRPARQEAQNIREFTGNMLAEFSKENPHLAPSTTGLRPF